MRKQALVIGLGQFGLALSQALTERGIEVIAVDTRQDRVQDASHFAAQAVCLDASDAEALSSLAPARRDFCVCTLGDDSREGGILVTALLRQLGARHIVARATDSLLERILRLVGAHEVVNPERDFGERMARRLLHVGELEEIPLGQDLVISELRPRPSMVGRSLVELGLQRRFGLTVLGIRVTSDGIQKMLPVDPARLLADTDLLIVAGRPGAAQSLSDKW